MYKWNALNPEEEVISQLLWHTNNLLSAVGINAKKISSANELTRVASSMFVAVFEALFHVRLEDIVRNPQTKEDYENNAQRVIDEMSDQIEMDLQHISGRSVVQGDIQALSNLVQIFVRIVAITRYVDSQKDKDPLLPLI